MIKVAIAEDDFRIADINEQFLLKLDGLEVVGKALNGQDLFQLLTEKEVDLLLLDIYLPDIQGIDLLPDIRYHWPSIDIIVITAATDMEIIKGSIGYGVFDYIIKPLRMERFLETIKKYKHKKQILRSNQEADQKTVDQLLNSVSEYVPQPADHFPKGIDPLTLNKVKELAESETNGVTAEEMGKKMGASRTTARRYLEYLTSTGDIKTELDYGVVGRPERIYHFASR